MTTLNRREVMLQLGATVAGSMALSAVRADDKPAATPSKIKIGQIGVGHAHARPTLLTHRGSADFEVVGIVEPDDELRKQAELDPAFRGLQWMTQEQLLNAPGLQGVLVETRVRDLLNVAEACVSAGKHVHIDKPAGESLPQFKRILDSAAKQNLLVQMGYIYRFNPAMTLLRDFVSQGWLGEIFEVHTVISKLCSTEQRAEIAAYQGGILFELGSHVIDVVVTLLGKPDHVTPYVQHASTSDDKLADNMLAVFNYPRALATVKSSALEVDGSKRRHLTVCGTEGTFHIEPLDNPSVRLTLSKARGKYKSGTQEIKLPKFTRYINEAADMARIIRGEKTSDFSYEHDLAVQTALLQACNLPTT